MQLGEFLGNFLDLFNQDKSPIYNPKKTFEIIINKANKLSKKVTINYII